MSDTELPPNPCEYIFHESGIHEFIIRCSSLEGAYSYLEQIEPIYATHNRANPPLRVIINTMSESLPMNYKLLQDGRAMRERHPDLGIIYLAVLTDDFVAARLVDLFIRMVRYPSITVRFFEHARHDDAVQWLLKPH